MPHRWYFPDDTPPMSLQGIAVSRAIQGGILDSTVTTITFPSSELWDTFEGHDITSNTEQLHPNLSGNYLIGIAGEWEGNSAGDRYIYLRRSDDGGVPLNFTERNAVWKTPTSIIIPDVISQQNVDDSVYYYFNVYQDSGVTLKFNKAKMFITRVGSL